MRQNTCGLVCDIARLFVRIALVFESLVFVGLTFSRLITLPADHDKHATEGRLDQNDEGSSWKS